MINKTRAMIASAAIAGLISGSALRAFGGTDHNGKPGGQQSGIEKMGCNSKDSCKGNNSCKGSHDCKGQNDCKGKGGCKSGDNGCRGQNSCKGKGGCKTEKPNKEE